MKKYFDLSLLPKAISQFTILSDTHYTISDGIGFHEFASRSKQTKRAATALTMAASLPSDFTVHLGDLVQDFPGTASFTRALKNSMEQIRDRGLNPYFVPGNHDVGDKPDPTMPTHPTEKKNLDRYHKQVSPSYYAFDCGQIRGLVINSQTLNTRHSKSQRKFLEEELVNCNRNEKRIAIFLHLPPYLYKPDEVSWGHYDNIGEPDRSWLLHLLKKHNVELVCCGHTHFAFLNKINKTKIVVCPSTSFTRPGFGHLFTGPSAPEQGRDDRAKLGFYWGRVFKDRIDIHFVRTNGLETLENDQKTLVTRLPSSLKGSPLGITLTHPICNITEIPITFPSITRQKVRNDYPLMAIMELGVTKLRVPWTDIQDPLQYERLELLRNDGVEIQAFIQPQTNEHLHTLFDLISNKVDVLEIQTVGNSIPNDQTLEVLQDFQKRIPLSLSTIMPFQKINGKQHPRPRIGFLHKELHELNSILSIKGIIVDRVSCRVNIEQDLGKIENSFNNPAFNAIGKIDWLIGLTDCDDEKNAQLAAKTLFSHFQTSLSSIFFDPPIDLDRTMDKTNGLLDVQCNPRPIFNVLRALNTILHVYRGKGYVVKKDQTRYQIHSNIADVELFLPNQKIRKSTNMLFFDLMKCSRIEQTEIENFSSTISLAVYPR